MCQPKGHVTRICWWQDGKRRVIGYVLGKMNDDELEMSLSKLAEMPLEELMNRPVQLRKGHVTSLAVLRSHRRLGVSLIEQALRLLATSLPMLRSRTRLRVSLVDHTDGL